jgi:hypothetical protein
MSVQTDDPHDAYRERIRELEEIEDELRLLADQNLPVSDRCQRLLDKLEEVRDGA